MSADELRQAAETLRARAEKADPHPWKQDSSVPGDTVIFDRDGEWTTNVASSRTYASGVVCHDHDEANGIYIATMHPGVGLALADWLYHEAVSAKAGVVIGADYPSMRLARLINGGVA